MKAARCHWPSPDCTYIKYFLALLLFGSNGIIADSIDLKSSQIILLRTFLGSLLLTLIAVRLHTSILFPGHRYSCILLVHHHDGYVQFVARSVVLLASSSATIFAAAKSDC